MSANNRVILHGKIASDVTLEGSEGKERTSFSLAVKKDYKVKEGEKDAYFIRIQAWGKTAVSISRYVGKGCEVLLEGSIVTGSYTKADGQVVYTTDVKVDNITYITFKDAKDVQQTPPQEPQPDPAPAPQAAPPQQMTTSELQQAADALTDDTIPF